MSRLSAPIVGILLTVAGVAWAAGETPLKQVVIDQGVDQATLAQYHYTDQGTRLIPAAWLDALTLSDGKRVMDPQVMRELGFLYDDKPNPGNPYNWPIGFTVSDPKMTGGIPIAGLTCAACHTGQVEYKGAAIRIEGGQSMIDLAGFAENAIKAVTILIKDKARLAKFEVDAVKAGYPADRITPDLKAVAEAFKSFHGGPSFYQLHEVVAGHGRYDAVQGIANQVFSGDLGVPSNAKPLDAPVNYPQLWDIGRLSWLQYNALLPPLSTSRNIGETLGTRAQTHITDRKTGNLNPLPERWKSSIQLENILWIEKAVDSLKAPTWPAAVLGPIDQAKAEAGRQLFGQHCAGCHGIKELPSGQWDVTVVPLDRIGTDPGQATNWAGRTYDGSKLGLGIQPPAKGLSAAVNALRKQLYADYKIPASEQESDAHLLAPCGYKARPLIGVWATSPFLHNGSVRTVYDLLSDQRTTKFTFGSREYDPAKLGYTEDPAPGAVVLDATGLGNSNKGHWWTDDTSRPGRIGPKLSEDEKYAVIEYLKAANYDNYPRETRTTAHAVPCQDDPGWALKATKK